MKLRDAYPLVIALPDGVQAELIPSKRPPRYMIDGKPCAIDVTIPPDLSDWYWHGSSFVHDAFTAFDTVVYPPPGAPYIPLLDCFAAARAFRGMSAPLVQMELGI